MTVKLGIIGAGVMGADHARIFAQELPGASLSVICDTDLSRAQRVARQYGAGAAGDDPQAIIARPDVDAIVIASPDVTHAPLTLAAIAAGKPVLCEKPLSQSVEDCLQVMAAERASGARHVMLGFMRRYDQSYLEMASALSEGGLGRALMMHNFHRNVETPASDFTGAMAITNSAPHEFDIARHVLATDFASVSAFQPKRSDDLVAPVVMVLETTDDQLVTIEINNNAAYGYDVRAELVGELGSVSTNAVAYSRTEANRASSTGYDADWRGRYNEAYRRQNRAFLQFVTTGAFPQTAAGCWDGYCATRVARTAVAALESGSRQAVEMVEQPGFYRD